MTDETARHLRVPRTAADDRRGRAELIAELNAGIVAATVAVSVLQAADAGEGPVGMMVPGLTERRLESARVAASALSEACRDVVTAAAPDRVPVLDRFAALARAGARMDRDGQGPGKG